MSNRQNMMRHRRTSMGQTLGEPRTVTRRSAAVLLTVDDQDRRTYPDGSANQP
jgi:hypothetical protein